MLGVNIAVGAHTAWPGVFPARLLVIDEFGTFASMAERMHRRGHGRAPRPRWTSGGRSNGRAARPGTG